MKKVRIKMDRITGWKDKENEQEMRNQSISYANSQLINANHS